MPLTRVLLLAISLVPVAVQAQTRYRVDMTAIQTMDDREVPFAQVTGSQPGSPGKLRADTTHSVQLITITSRDSAGGSAVRLVIDSSTTHSGKAFELFVLHGLVSPGVGIALRRQELTDVVNAVQLLFPGLKRGTGPGSRWADTTSIDSTSAELIGKGRNITTWFRASRDTVTSEHHGEVAVATSGVQGSGEATASEVTTYVLEDDRVRSAWTATDLRMDLRSPGMNTLSARVTVIMKLSVTRLP